MHHKRIESQPAEESPPQWDNRPVFSGIDPTIIRQREENNVNVDYNGGSDRPLTSLGTSTRTTELTPNAVGNYHHANDKRSKMCPFLSG